MDGSRESGSKWSFDEDKWELYNLEEDNSECHDLAEKHPEKLRRLVELWWAEAGKYNVLPLDDRLQERLIVARGGGLRNEHHIPTIPVL
jgi:arylsulfatase A-like enzyme